MLVEADVKGLEWVGCIYLSKDPVGYQEINNKVDQHSLNQKEFNLPTRLIAKTFVFRLIYGGTAYSYSVDPDFESVGYTEKQWQEVIDRFYKKYRAIAHWHNSLIHEAKINGFVRIPTGREFHFNPITKNGEPNWPRTQILNYPVQGLGADLVLLARILFWKRIQIHKEYIKIISTVHDSIICDCQPGVEELCAKELKYCVERIPETFEQYFGIPFDLPLTCEIKIGKNLGEMEEFH